LRACRARLAHVEPDLVEWNYGDYEGQRSPEIAKGRPGWNIFADGCPNGELPAQVPARADWLIQHLAALEGNVALFSHGHFSRVLAARWIGLPTITGQRLMLDTGTLSILQQDLRHSENRVIALWNATPSAP
jgi:probable phosphoglycerate mutase